MKNQQRRQKIKYPETEEQCRFIQRCIFFTLIYDTTDPVQTALNEKVFNLLLVVSGINKIKKDGTFARTNILLQKKFFSRRDFKYHGQGRYNEVFGITLLAEKLRPHLPLASFVFTLPGLHLNWNNRPRRLYQRYCRALSPLTDEEKEIINRENLRDHKKNPMDDCGHVGPEFDCYVPLIWRFMQEEKDYIPVLSEIKFWYKKWKDKRFYDKWMHSI